MGPRWRNVLGAAVVALVLATAGCGAGEVEGEATTTTVAPGTTTGPTPPSTALSDEDAVLAAYQGYWDTWLAANDPPDPDHPDLAKYATGAALERARQSILQNRSVGRVLRVGAGSQYRHAASDVRISANSAHLVDCAVDDGVVVDWGSGAILNDAVSTRLYSADLVRVEGQWQLAEVSAEAKWDGVAGCAVDG